MPSLFLRTTKSLVRELGRKGELVPVDSLNSSPRLRPFCLLRKKHKRYLWPWDTRLIPTDFSLLDMLEPGCPDPEVSHSSPINVWEKVAGGLTGAASLSTGLQGQVTGNSKTTCISALTVQTLWVPPCTWEMLLEKRKLRVPRPSFLQELWSRKERESLYVVTEVVETLQEAVLQSQGEMLGAGQLSLLQLGHVQVPSVTDLVAAWTPTQVIMGDMSVTSASLSEETRAQRKSLAEDHAATETWLRGHILLQDGSLYPGQSCCLLNMYELYGYGLGPSGPTLTYLSPTLQESCRDPDSLAICLQNTFLKLLEAQGGPSVRFSLPPSQVQVQSHMDTEKTVSIPQGSILAYRVLQLVVEEDGWAVLHFPERKLCGVTRRGLAFSQDSEEESNFQSLQDQAHGQLQDLAAMSSELRDTLLGAFQELLQDRQALQELEDMLEQALDTGLLAQLEGPGGFVLSILQDSTGNLSWSRGRAILYILGALAALSEPQHCLLAQSIERRILAKELELVVSILEHNYNQMEEATCPLPTEVLSALKSEDVVLILSLVQSCGLELEQPSCQLTWDPTVMPQLSALYGCLTGMQLLAGLSPGLSSEEGTLICP